MQHFIPVGLDTYFRGNAEEEAFCRQVGAGGNELVVTTAHGDVLDAGQHLRLRRAELGPVLQEYHSLPLENRQAALTLGVNTTPSQRPTPPPPENGLILRGYCSYLDRDSQGTVVRPTQYYYRENPDRWAAETQSDMLWLTESEWKSLLPNKWDVGQQVAVPDRIQCRFFSNLGIDYMEGSVNSLPCRTHEMTIVVTEVQRDQAQLRLDGYATIGKEFDPQLRKQRETRGCEIRIVGQLTYDLKHNAFARFDVVGVGEAWGNKMDYVNREVRIDDYPWMYGIATELVTTREPIDLIPPYNLLHYNSSGREYFKE